MMTRPDLWALIEPFPLFGQVPQYRPCVLNFFPQYFFLYIDAENDVTHKILRNLQNVL